MKKLIAIFSLVCAVFVANAQNTPTVPAVNVPAIGRATLFDSLVNTDTSILIFPQIGSNVKSFQITALKSSGTLSGKVYLRVTNDGVAWKNIDSLTLADVTTAQPLWNIPSHTSYSTYGTYAVTSGTQKYYLYFTAVRRQDENGY